jgi:hypothetical protein
VETEGVIVGWTRSSLIVCRSLVTGEDEDLAELAGRSTEAESTTALSVTFGHAALFLNVSVKGVMASS